MLKHCTPEVLLLQFDTHSNKTPVRTLRNALCITSVQVNGPVEPTGLRHFQSGQLISDFGLSTSDLYFKNDIFFVCLNPTVTNW